MSYFGTIYADTELSSRARAVYMYLRDRADSEGKCWPGINKFRPSKNSFLLLEQSRA